MPCFAPRQNQQPQYWLTRPGHTLTWPSRFTHHTSCRAEVTPAAILSNTAVLREEQETPICGTLKAAVNGSRCCYMPEEEHLDPHVFLDHWRKVARLPQAQCPLEPPVCICPHPAHSSWNQSQTTPQLCKLQRINPLCPKTLPPAAGLHEGQENPPPQGTPVTWQGPTPCPLPRGRRTGTHSKEAGSRDWGVERRCFIVFMCFLDTQIRN